jgi:hypothetical protein
MNRIQQEIVSDILVHWQSQVQNETFNGLKLRELKKNYSEAELTTNLSDLVLSKQIEIISSPPYDNPHIKRFPALEPKQQLEYLDVSERYHTCLYPSRELVEREIDLVSLVSRPFSKRLALCDHQLKSVAFEVVVIDRYRRDPRFSFYFNDFIGRASLSIPEDEYENTADRDKTFINTFGLALNETLYPGVSAFLRYLANLTPEHQQHWATYELGEDYRMCEQYYRSTILGEFYSNNGSSNALRHSVRIINEASQQISGIKIFKNEIADELHFSVSTLMDNTTAELNAFYEELDKLVSENLNETSIRKVLGNQAPADERSIGLFKRFLATLGSSWSGKDVSDLIKPIQHLRGLRSKSAHQILPNKKTNEVYSERRGVFGDIIWSLGSIALHLAKHPKAKNISIPDWLKERDIQIL